jgi:hypothetical protein
MMLRSLVDEVVRRRLWPILALAIVVAVAAPLLFMKSAPSGAPGASAAPPPAKLGKLPTTGAKLVTASDKAVTPRHKTKGTTGKDPFAPPAGEVQASAAAKAPAASPSTAPAAKSSAKASTKPVPVIITDSNGTRLTVRSGGGTKTSSKKKTTTAAVSADVDTVDVRFGERWGSYVRGGFKQLKTLKVDGKVAAVFVKWSPNRKKAVFAIPASTIVSGDVDCRRKEGVCRYVDIPIGKYARLTWLTADGGSYVTRRLDVVHVHLG